MTMPATISRTTDGRRTPGNRPSRNGAANATTETMSRLVNEGISLPPCDGCRRAPPFRYEQSASPAGDGDAEHRRERGARSDATQALSAAQRVRRSRHGLEAHELGAGRREDLRGRIAGHEGHDELPTATRDAELRAVRDAVETVVEAAAAQAQPGRALIRVVTGRDASIVGDQIAPSGKLELPHRAVNAGKPQVRVIAEGHGHRHDVTRRQRGRDREAVGVEDGFEPERVWERESGEQL